MRQSYQKCRKPLPLYTTQRNMPSYKLLYFEGRGRAETARMLFALAGVDYVDERVLEEGWPTSPLKPTTLFGQLPVLYVDDVQIAQSHAIERFLSRRFGYAGKNDIEDAQIDMLVDTVEDLMHVLMQIFFEENEARKTELREKCEKEILPQKLGYLEKFLSSNQGGDGYFVGDSITFADISFANLTTNLELAEVAVKYDIKGKHQKLAALVERVFKEPKIAEWIAKRPESSF